ncbi:hypothetical protein ABKN59_008862 [Abortiporus biennis]
MERKECDDEMSRDTSMNSIGWIHGGFQYVFHLHAGNAIHYRARITWQFGAFQLMTTCRLIALIHLMSCNIHGERRTYSPSFGTLDTLNYGPLLHHLRESTVEFQKSELPRCRP